MCFRARFFVTLLYLIRCLAFSYRICATWFTQGWWDKAQTHALFELGWVAGHEHIRNGEIGNRDMTVTPCLTACFFGRRWWWGFRHGFRGILLGGGHGGPAGGARIWCLLILQYEIDKKLVVTLSGRHCGHALGPVRCHSGVQ